MTVDSGTEWEKRESERTVLTLARMAPSPSPGKTYCTRSSDPNQVTNDDDERGESAN